MLDGIQAFCLPFVGEHFARVSVMQPISVIRRKNLAELVDEEGGQAPFATKIGKDKNQVYQWLIEDESNPQSRKMSHSTARKIEALCDKPDGWLDVLHEVGVREAAQEYRSQPERPTLDIIYRAMDFLEEMFEARGKQYDRRAYPLLTAAVVEDLMLPVPPSVVQLSFKYGNAVDEGHDWTGNALTGTG